MKVKTLTNFDQEILYRIFDPKQRSILMDFFEFYRNHWLEKISQDKDFVDQFNQTKLSTLIRGIDDSYQNYLESFSNVEKIFRNLLGFIFGYTGDGYLKFGYEARLFELKKVIQETDPSNLDSLEKFFNDKNGCGLFSRTWYENPYLHNSKFFKLHSKFRLKEAVASVNFNHVFSPSFDTKLPVDYFFNDTRQRPYYVSSRVLSDLLMLTVRESIETQIIEKFNEVAADNPINAEIALALQNFFCSWKMARTPEKNNPKFKNFYSWDNAYQSEIIKQQQKSLRDLNQEINAILANSEVSENVPLSNNLRALRIDPENFLREFSVSENYHQSYFLKERGIGEEASLSAMASFLKVVMSPVEYDQFIKQVTHETMQFSVEKMKILLTDTENTQNIESEIGINNARQNFENKYHLLIVSANENSQASFEKIFHGNSDENGKIPSDTVNKAESLENKPSRSF